ncbi:MAG: hypothetical protein KGO02_21215 [Alphaproteobacteria bacterium]|nr:hypothetical protein [Alphaproteobacteria bacterium]
MGAARKVISLLRHKEQHGQIGLNAMQRDYWDPSTEPRTSSPAFALSGSDGSTHQIPGSTESQDLPHDRLAHDIATLEKKARRVLAGAQEKLCYELSGAAFGMFTLGWYRVAARAKKRKETLPPLLDDATQKDHLNRVEAPMVALSMIREFGAEAYAMAVAKTDAAQAAGDVIVAGQWRRIALIIHREDASNAKLRASTDTTQSGSPRRRLGRWRASPVH